MKKIAPFLRCCLAAAFLLSSAEGVFAAQKKAKPAARRGPPIIRDAEIEGLLRTYAKPIFNAAGLNPSAVKVYVINDRRINAFVAGGQRIFIHTGLITQSDNPNEVIGVLAHEAGHIAGGHLARLGIELDRASAQSIIGTLIGAAAVIGGAVAGSSAASEAGTGVLIGSQGIARRSVLSYQRGMESAADQAALKYLNKTGQSAEGMLTLFRKLANASLASSVNSDPYLQSHPMAFERISTLAAEAKKSPTFGKPDSDDLVQRHALAKAKLAGFLESPQVVYARYPSSDKSMPARYARAIVMYRKGDMKNAIPVIDSLIANNPKNPYFWELKGQAYLESGQSAAAIAPLKKSLSLLPNNGLIQLLYAQALLDREDGPSAKEALILLKKARKTEIDTPQVYRLMAKSYAISGDPLRADLAIAEASMLTGDRALAIQKAKALQDQFKTGTPEWLRVNDILNFATKK